MKQQNKMFKIWEDFGDCYCIANEKGVIECANNDREKEDGTIAEEFKDLDNAIKFLTEEKMLNVEEIDVIEQTENYVVFEQ